MFTFTMVLMVLWSILHIILYLIVYCEYPDYKRTWGTRLIVLVEWGFYIMVILMAVKFIGGING